MNDVRHIRRARAADYDPLVELWERSVRATHDFLTEADIGTLRPLVREALSDDALELWVLTESQLVAHAQQLREGPLTVDVNEQNPAALGFYEALGFVVVGRSPLDGDGRPFPLLHMLRPAASDPSTRPAD